MKKTFKELLMSQAAIEFNEPNLWETILNDMDSTVHHRISRSETEYVTKIEDGGDIRYFRCVETNSGWLIDDAVEVYPHDLTVIKYLDEPQQEKYYEKDTKTTND